MKNKETIDTTLVKKAHLLGHDWFTLFGDGSFYPDYQKMERGLEILGLWKSHYVSFTRFPGLEEKLCSYFQGFYIYLL